MKYAGINLSDAGYKPDQSSSPELVNTKIKEPEIRYPELYLDDKELSAITSKECKDECIMIAVVKVKSKTEETITEDGKEKERTRATLQILKAGFTSYGKKVDDMDDDEIDEKLGDSKSK
jgi:hypothetical protein